MKFLLLKFLCLFCLLGWYQISKQRLSNSSLQRGTFALVSELSSLIFQESPWPPECCVWGLGGPLWRPFTPEWGESHLISVCMPLHGVPVMIDPSTQRHPLSLLIKDFWEFGKKASPAKSLSTKWKKIAFWHCQPNFELTIANLTLRYSIANQLHYRQLQTTCILWWRKTLLWIHWRFSTLGMKSFDAAIVNGVSANCFEWSSHCSKASIKFIVLFAVWHCSILSSAPSECPTLPLGFLCWLWLSFG